jgi:transketolase
MAAYAGLSDSFDGPTHHSVCDLAIMRSLPNMTIIVPGDPSALGKLLPQAAEWEGPVYFRLNRNEVPVLFDDTYDPKIGHAVTLRPGGDVTIICAGVMVSRSLDAAQVLAGKGIEARVLEVHTIKPIDRESIIRAARETKALVTAEEHSVVGGLGGAVAEVVTGEFPVPVRRVGVPDRFAETGPYEVILDRYGMSVDDIIAASSGAVADKKK